MSGDFNPLHVDPLHARRTMFGAPVVHGIHMLLLGLGEVLPAGARLTRLKAAFRLPLTIGTPVTLDTDRPGRFRLKARGEGIANVSYDIETATQTTIPISSRVPAREACQEWGENEIESACGTTSLTLPREKLERLLPGFSGKLDRGQIAILLASTRMVGMACPGLYSIYRDLDLTFSPPEPEAEPVFSWAVRRFRRQFVLATLDVSAPGMRGTAGAFLRPKPATQPAFTDLKQGAGLPNFSKEKSLVVGGSRGLGELTAKMLAAGGADVVLTYHRGQDDAERVAGEITDGGGKARKTALDVMDLPEDISRILPAGWRPTQIFYFATPPITGTVKGRFRPDLLERFNEWYVRAFHDLVMAFGPMRDQPMTVFYPSSVFVADTPSNMGEYAASKSAGETLCSFLQATVKGLTVHVARLPRLPTDQTMAVVPLSVADPIDVMSEVLGKLAGR